MKKKIILIGILIGFGLILNAETIDWLSYPTNPYLAARGGAFILKRDFSNIIYNPSVLPMIKERGVILSGSALSFGRNIAEIGISTRLEGNVCPFFALKYNLISGFEEADRFGTQTGTKFSISRIAFFGGFSYRFGRRPVSASLSFKYFLNDYYQNKGEGYGVKLNATVFLRKFSIGIFVDNLAQVITWDTGLEETEPIVFGSSFLYRITDKLRAGLIEQCNFSIFLSKDDDDLSANFNYGLGLEYDINKKFNIGVGSMNQNISFGITYKKNKISINYGFQIERNFVGINNLLGFGYRF
jgi:hypothetical protein